MFASQPRALARAPARKANGLPVAARSHRIAPRASTRRAPRAPAAVPELAAAAADASSSSTATLAAEVGLSATALLAGLTFGVAPRFRELFKEDVDWKQIFAELTEAGGVETVSVEDAARAVAAAAPDVLLLDVRPAADFAAVRAPGASSSSVVVNVPLYIPIQKWDAPSVIRRLAFAFFGIAGTEPNPAFDADALSALQGKRRVLVLCQTGGSLTPKEGAAWGFSSRSLKAIWRLRRAGAAPRLVHVSGGMREWVRGGAGGKGGEDGAAAVELATVGPDGAFDDDDDALEDLREVLGVRPAAAAGGGEGGQRAASPVEGVLAAVRGLFGGEGR